MRKLVTMALVVAVMMSAPYGLMAKGKGKGIKRSSAHAAETTFGNALGFGWQERARVCTALTADQCRLVVELQTGGADGGGASGAAADSAAASGNGATGASGPR